MRAKIIYAITMAGLFALTACSDDSTPSDATNPLGEQFSPQESSDSSEGDGRFDVDISSSENGEFLEESSASEENSSEESFSTTEEGNEQGENSTSVKSGQETSSTSQPEFSFGWAKGNAPVPTRGCGKDFSFPKSGSFDYTWTYKGQSYTRTVYYDMPNSYDKNKPYRLFFGMHCMSGWAGGVKNEGYYGLKPLDTEETTIFIAPEGACHTDGCPPWGEEDHGLFDGLLDKFESELCIDSSRVFVAGFSFGSMYTNSLSRNHQDVIRAVAVYETADIRIYLPEHSGKPIAWMGVHGMNDGLCTPEMGQSALRTALQYASAEGKDATQEEYEEASKSQGQHICYNFKDVDERFPVRWCTDNAGHIWDHKDPGQEVSWVPETTWEFFTQF